MSLRLRVMLLIQEKANEPGNEQDVITEKATLYMSLRLHVMFHVAYS